MSATASFRRSFDALEEIFAFTSETFARESLEPSLRPVIDFVLEELFTNVVKYGRASPVSVQIELKKVPRGVEVILTEDDADRFDPSSAPEVDITAPIEERRPGGLGLHLVKKLVDSLDYRYNEDRRQGRITFRKTVQPTDTGGVDAGD